MKSVFGAPRKVTDLQVARILEWQRDRRSIDDWARIYGVSRGAVRDAIDNYLRGWICSRVGRKRALTFTEAQTIVRARAARLTRAQLAAELDLTKSQVGEVIRRRGEYKRCCPEQQETMKAAWRERFEREHQQPAPTASSLQLLRAQNAARAGLPLKAERA